MRVMSMRNFGSARRSFMSGRRLWPPARILDSPGFFCRRPIASSTLFAA